MIKLIVDSTTDLPQTYFEKYQIEIIPLIVNVNGVSFRDGIDISLDEVYQEMRKGSKIKTSQPNIQDVYDILEKHLQNQDDIIIITISSKLSGTYQTITLVKNQLLVDYPDAKITVIDSRGGSGVAGLMALQGTYMIEEGFSYDEVVANLIELSQNAEHIFTLDDLTYLFQGGRLTKAAAMLGNLLRVKPILDVQDGQIHLFDKVRHMRKALQYIANLVEERIRDFPDQIIGIMHGDDIELAYELRDLIVERIGEKLFILDQIGSTLGSHLGIRGVGVFFFNKKPHYYRNEL